MFRYIRLKDWWSFIIPPIITFYCIGLILINSKSSTLSTLLFSFVLFLVLTISTAAFGFFINEWSDIKDDTIAGKENTLSNAKQHTLILLLLFIISGIVASAYLLKLNKITQIIICVQLILLLLYSVPPFRLKRFKYLAVILDATYSGALFYILAIIIGSNYHRFSIIWMYLLFFWSITKGIRNILHHLIQNKKYDAALRFKTVATANNTSTLEHFIFFGLLPLESILFILFLYRFYYGKLFIILYLLYWVYIIFRKNYIIPFIIKRKQTITHSMSTEINLFYEKIFPLFVFIVLCYKDVRMLILFALYLIVFFIPMVLKKV